MEPMEPMLQFFAYDHLPETAARRVRAVLHAGAGDRRHAAAQSRAHAWRCASCLEAKDCAVRAMLWKAD